MTGDSLHDKNYSKSAEKAGNINLVKREIHQMKLELKWSNEIFISTVKKEDFVLPDSKNKCRFPASHFWLETSLIVFTQSGSRWSCLECLPCLNAISTS